MTWGTLAMVVYRGEWTHSARKNYLAEQKSQK